MSRYLVTGHTGFLGRQLVTLLLSQGHSLVAYARGVHGHCELPGVEEHRGDILDRALLARAMQGVQGVFHCAGLVSRDPNDAGLLHSVHVGGTRAVLDAAESAGVPRVVLASSSGTVGLREDGKVLPTESSPVPWALVQRFPYYRAKLFAEQEALGRSRPGFSVLSANPSLLLGPGDRFGSSTGDVLQFLRGELPAVPRGGVAFVDVRDAADGMVRMMLAGKPGTRLLFSAQNLTVAEFFAQLERLSGVRAPSLPLPLSGPVSRSVSDLLQRTLQKLGAHTPVDPVSVEMGQYFWWVNAERATRELGWKPRAPLDTLLDTVLDLKPRERTGIARVSAPRLG